jgi:hypothetical protein
MGASGAVKTDVKAEIKKFLDEAVANGGKDGGWIIKEKKSTPDSDSFILKLTKQKGDANDTMGNNGDEDLVGMAFSNDIKYAGDTIHSNSLLVEAPDAMKDEPKKKEIFDKLIEKKTIEIISDYNTQTHLYTVALKDIDDLIGKANLKVVNTKISGTYDPDDAINRAVTINIEKIDATPISKELLGEYFRVNNFKVDSNTKVKGSMIDLNYAITLESLDANVSKETTVAKGFNFSVVLGNLDKASYEAVEKFGKDHPVPSPQDQEKLIELSTKLLTSKGIFVEITNFDIASLIVKGQDMGSAKINAKAKLEDNPQVIQMIAISPMMALSALEVDAKIELSKEMLAALMKDPRAAMLGMLPPKEANGKVVYEIKFVKGKLSINGQNF